MFLVLSMPFSSNQWNSSIGAPSSEAFPAGGADIKTKFLFELSGSLDEVRWINDANSNLTVGVHSASKGLLGAWREGDVAYIILGLSTVLHLSLYSAFVVFCQREPTGFSRTIAPLLAKRLLTSRARDGTGASGGPEAPCMAAVVTAHASGCLGVALFEVDVASGESQPFCFYILLLDLIHLS